jgi:hypothetical protein
MGIQLPEVCANQCAACTGGNVADWEETKQYEDMKTTRNFDSFVDVMDMPSPTRATFTSTISPDNSATAACLPMTNIPIKKENAAVTSKSNTKTNTTRRLSMPLETQTPTRLTPASDTGGGPLTLAFSYELSPTRSRDSTGTHTRRRNSLLFVGANDSNDVSSNIHKMEEEPESSNTEAQNLNAIHSKGTTGSSTASQGSRDSSQKHAPRSKGSGADNHTNRASSRQRSRGSSQRNRSTSSQSKDRRAPGSGPRDIFSASCKVADL